jgi:hypothetical protein
LRADEVRLYTGFGIAAALLTGFGLLADQVTDGDTTAFDNAAVMMFRDPAAPEVPLGPSRRCAISRRSAAFRCWESSPSAWCCTSC